MKKMLFTILRVMLVLLTAIGCKSQGQSKTTDENETVKTEITKDNTENSTSNKYQNTPKAQKILEANQEEDKKKDNTEIDKKYKEIDKYNLDYNANYSSTTYYEIENGFAGSESGIPSINNTKYMEILKDYTYASEVNPTNVTYEDAIKLSKSVLPDDIKEIRKKYDSTTTKTSIVYSSSQGNFVVGISYDYAQAHTDGFIPSSYKNTVVGIDYMKEIIK